MCNIHRPLSSLEFFRWGMYWTDKHEMEHSLNVNIISNGSSIKYYCLVRGPQRKLSIELQHRSGQAVKPKLPPLGGQIPTPFASKVMGYTGELLKVYSPTFIDCYGMTCKIEKKSFLLCLNWPFLLSFICSRFSYHQPYGTRR